MAPDKREKQSYSLIVMKDSRTGGSVIEGLVGRVFRVPHSTLPGFMRPWGSSVALSFRMVSMPTGPTSSCSSCRLPSPMPCSPVHVPWSASARLGENGKGSQWGALPLASAPPAPPWPGLCSCLPSWCAKASALQYSSASSGSTVRRQWKLPSPTCPMMDPGGPENRAAALSPALHPVFPSHAPAVCKQNL